MKLNVTSLYERIQDTISSLIIFSNSDDDWVTFIMDHKEYIKNNSTPITITLEDKNKYKYMFKAFLRSKNFRQESFWIIAIINNLTDPDKEFTERNYLFIPSQDTITNLYRKYKTSKKLKT